MARIHKATLRPTKLELIAAWLPAQPWFGGEPLGALAQIGAFRFDDPAGEVGLQVLLVQSGEDAPLYQVPMTYRAEPRADGAARIGEMTHSVLGPRYVYDGCGDPVFVGQLVRAMLTGGTEVDEHVEVDGETITMPKTVTVRGSGQAATVPALGPLDVAADSGDATTMVVRTAALEVTVPRVVVPGTTIDGAATLDATWGDGQTACLAAVRSV